MSTLVASAKTTLLPAHQSEILNLEWGQLTWFASAAQGNCQELTVGRCILDPGQANPLHRHPNCTEILVVQEGHIMHTVEDGREVEMRSGDTITIPANLPHRARNVGQTPAILTIVFSSAHRETVGE